MSHEKKMIGTTTNRTNHFDNDEIYVAVCTASSTNEPDGPMLKSADFTPEKIYGVPAIDKLGAKVKPITQT